MHKNEFVTSDPYLYAALLILLKLQASFKVEPNGRVSFTLPITDKVYKALQEYNEGVSLPAIEYADMIKMVRSGMYSRKGGGA
jgi:hypothetical protein